MADKKEKTVTKDVEIEVDAKSIASEVIEQVQSEIDGVVEKATEKVDKYAKKVIFSEREEDKAALTEAEKVKEVGEFFRALSQGDVKTVRDMSNTRAKAMNEGTGSAGGYLVPEEFERWINVKMDEYSQLRQDATVLPMGTDVKRLNELTTDPTVAIIGEASQITESTPAYGEPVLTARKYAGITAFSNEVEADAELAILPLLAERFAERLSQKEQDEFMNGTTSGSEGLLQVTGVTAVNMAATKTSFADATFDNLKDMDTELAEYSIMESKKGKYYMSPYVWGVISQTKPTNSGYYGGNPVDGWKAQAWGREVVELNESPQQSDDAVSTKFVVLADLSRHLMIGDRAGISVTIGSEGTVGSNKLFEQDMRALRVVKRTANTTSLESGIIVLVTAAS